MDRLVMRAMRYERCFAARRYWQGILRRPSPPHLRLFLTRHVQRTREFGLWMCTVAFRYCLQMGGFKAE